MLVLSLFVVGAVLNEEVALRRICRNLAYAGERMYLRDQYSIQLLLIVSFSSWGKGFLLGGLLQAVCPKNWELLAGVYLLGNICSLYPRLKRAYTPWLALAGIVCSCQAGLFQLTLAISLAVMLLEHSFQKGSQAGRAVLAAVSYLALPIWICIVYSTIFIGGTIREIQAPFLARLIK